MKIPKLCVSLSILFVLSLVTEVSAQTYDLLLKGGRVIDPANQMNAPRDVAVKGDRIALVAENIPASEAKKVVDVTGYYVTPGLVDIHAHVFVEDPGG
ncbi:MAG: hypothetical protein MUP80_03245, partial [Acidobacteriia bacterium]|nr:hypothetical protein [Terriglobia bacterium]